MPADALDVNVHPTKAEVRFRDQSYIHELVRRALGDALGRGPSPELQLLAPPAGRLEPSTLPLPHAYAAVYPSRWTAGGVAGAGEVAPVSDAAFAPFAPARDELIAPANEGAIALTGGAAVTPTIDNAIALKPLMPLGQFRDTFIIAVDEDGIAIIDQHVAHERILFERITDRLTSGRLESQRLLEPMLLEMSAAGRQALVGHVHEIERLGFEVEEFGGGSLRVSAFPALLTREYCEAALRALAEDLEGLGSATKVEEALKRIAATMACHAAVKANYPLTMEKMAHILEELRRTAYSTICPHGRPVMLRLTRREVEKNFQRI
jgi:DNA mismatch repair protein MutL